MTPSSWLLALGSLLLRRSVASDQTFIVLLHRVYYMGRSAGIWYMANSTATATTSLLAQSLRFLLLTLLAWAFCFPSFFFFSYRTVAVRQPVFLFGFVRKWPHNQFLNANARSEPRRPRTKRSKQAKGKSSTWPSDMQAESRKGAVLAGQEVQWTLEKHWGSVFLHWILRFGFNYYLRVFGSPFSIIFIETLSRFSIILVWVTFSVFTSLDLGHLFSIYFSRFGSRSSP